MAAGQLSDPQVHAMVAVPAASAASASARRWRWVRGSLRHTVDASWSSRRSNTAASGARTLPQISAIPFWSGSWTATEKLRFVRVTPTAITGRRFVFGPEPDRGTVPG